jgi:hypothetical protein
VSSSLQCSNAHVRLSTLRFCASRLLLTTLLQEPHVGMSRASRSHTPVSNSPLTIQQITRLLELFQVIKKIHSGRFPTGIVAGSTHEKICYYSAIHQPPKSLDIAG